MKKLTHFIAVTLLASAFAQPLYAVDRSAASPSSDTTASTPASGEAAGGASTKKGMSMSSLLQQLQKAGYIVRSVEYNKDDGTYKVDAVDRRGEKQSLDVNAASGLSQEQKKSPREVSLSQAAKKLEKGGSYIRSISTDNNAYKATVVDNKGNEQDYTIDIQTGKVSQ